MTASTNYASIRASVDSASDDALSRVEVNQRALIDKILARYASQGAVYRELIQNSNDADATEAEIYFTTNDATTATTSVNNSTSSNIVTQVVYRNNGMPFRGQDWDRLKKIAEGNPDVSKVGAFGVGAYTMFSICEEPLVLSGDSALAFVWKGDALWTKTIPNTNNDIISKTADGQTKDSKKWTSFILPSRDPYPVPDLIEFGEFLCASLTFTAKLRSLKLFVNDKQRLYIQKTIAQEPRLVQTPKSSTSSFFGLWNSNQAVTSSTQGVFSLAKSSNGVPAIYESIHRMTVTIDNDTATLDARYVSAKGNTNIPSDMARRMERVTKKNPPSTVDIQIFLNAAALSVSSHKNGKNKAEKIVQSFSPRAGQGRIFIGFRTSQTTGLAAHLAAPFVPTVEREAMDLQDAALRVFNTELLEFSGILMRLTLEHTMLNVIGVDWEKNSEQRVKEDQELLLKLKDKNYTVATTSTTNPATSSNETISNDNDEDDVIDDDDGSNHPGGGGGGLMGFARFMARGVKQSIVSVAKTVGNLVETNSDPLLYPPDPRPLCMEEKQAVVLMQSFCPQQSTPDATVGTFLATGFSRCLPNQSPPVLTRSGVMRGDLARLPHYGIESFCQHNTIRTVVLQNCVEYHTVIARCKRLTFEDLYESISNQILDEENAVKLIHWWVKYSRVEPVDATQKGVALKQIIKFHPTENSNGAVSTVSIATTSEVGESSERPVIELQKWNYYFDKDSYFATRPMLPLPDSVIVRRLQSKIGLSVLTDTSLYRWFNTLPIEVWASFVSTHSCMKEGKPEDDLVRMQVLACLSQEYSRRVPHERPVFGGLCHNILADKRCIPYDSAEPAKENVDYPSDLYLASAELKAFQGVGNTAFRKVAASLRDAGVTDEFLLCLGVRKSVSIDFLFTNLDTLKWSEDPKPLIEYLCTATLSRNDMNKLSMTQYLPAENDKTRTYAPSQLYLPNSELRIFPFVKMLQWPTESDVSDKSTNGQFMTKLGMKTMPTLGTILEYVSLDDLQQQHRMTCLDFLCDRLGPHGTFHAAYTQMSQSQKKQFRFLPCRVHDPIEVCFASSQKSSIPLEQRCSPVTCFSDEICGIMAFPVIDPKYMGKKNSRLYGSLFQCEAEPDANVLLTQFGHLVNQAKTKQPKVTMTSDSVALLEATFASIFKYLSHRSADLNMSSLESLKRAAFIPIKTNETTIEWYRPDQVFFQRKESTQDNITAELFQIIEFNAFLAAAGVKEEATTRDLFIKVLNAPEEVLRTLGSEKKYRALLRRIAANPPFHPTRIPMEVKNSPFLLAYTVKPTVNQSGSSENESSKPTETTSHHLAKASDIYIIDNSFFARMFPVKRAPPESDLEDFYARLGSRYISQSVDRRFEIVGKAADDTTLTRAFKERLQERGPLLVSPSVTSRPLVPNAASVIEGKRLQVFEVKNLLAVYSLDGTVRRNQTTCCSREAGNKTNAIYIVSDFDWFDVGYAIGDLILRRCQLEDAFFISSLLEAPLEQLRSRGFPVDRILQSEPTVPYSPSSTPAVISASTIAQIPPPTIAQIPQRNATQNPPTNPVASAGRESVPSIEKSVVANESASTGTAAPSSEQPTVEKSAVDSAKTEGNQDISADGLHDILMQMFPGADPKYIKSSLGPNPSIDDVRNLAEKMSSGNYPKLDDASTTTASSSIDHPSSMDSKLGGRKTNGLRKKLGRAFGFGGNNAGAGMTPPTTQSGLSNSAGSTQGPGFVPPSAVNLQQKHTEQRQPVSPANDAQTQSSLERMLENMVDTSSNVNATGMHSNETKLTSIPADLDHDCEVIPAQSLKPYSGPRGNGKTRNGIRLFSSRFDPTSEAFLSEYDPVIESFAHVIERLCVGVFGLKMETIAIFHDSVGKVIAFNSNRSLHFNIRYFHSLHFLQNKHLGIECYSYWYMTIAHELAHHLVSAHTREHGFYTESYATHYLPKFVVLLNDL